jgi:hypothetical protein
MKIPNQLTEQRVQQIIRAEIKKRERTAPVFEQYVNIDGGRANTNYGGINGQADGGNALGN